jgi:hypothetical protein
MVTGRPIVEVRAVTVRPWSVDRSDAPSLRDGGADPIVGPRSGPGLPPQFKRRAAVENRGFEAPA